MDKRYEIGKWYKWQRNQGKIHYLKCTRTDSTWMYHYEHIYHNKYEKLDKEESWSLEEARECPIDEIQQYLPEGHVDKIKKEFFLEDNKFYHVQWALGNKFSYIFKYGGNQPCIVIDEQRYAGSGNDFNTKSSWKPIREATPEEKKWLEKCIELGKFVPKEEAMKENNVYVSGIDPVDNITKFIKYSSRNDNTLIYNHILNPDRKQYNNLINYQYTFRDIKNLSIDDIKWLNVCIEANEFISKEEALKKEEKPMEYADYYKCVKPYDKLFKEGVIYYHYNHDQMYYNNKHVSYCSQSPKNILEWFIPSTKEEYEAQFKKEMNTYGLKVGDLVSYKVLNAWLANGKNWYTNISGQNWIVEAKNPFGTGQGDRTIVSFGEREGVIGFFPSGCGNDLHIRAEGFKEFMDNFNKPKEKEEFCLKLGEEYTYAGRSTVWIVTEIGDKSVVFTEKGAPNNKPSYSRDQFPGLLNESQFQKVIKKPVEKAPQPPAKFKVGDIVDTNDKGGQYTRDGLDTDGQIPSSIFKELIIEDSYYNGKRWWYKLSQPINWFTEDSLVLHKKTVEVPEYVECVHEGTQWMEKGRIYRTEVREENRFGWFYEGPKAEKIGPGSDWDTHGEPWPNKVETWFKPSTKEAYEEQQNPKKVENNEDWCVEKTEHNLPDLKKWYKKETCGDTIGGYSKYYGKKNGCVDFEETPWGKLISTEEFYKKIGKISIKTEEWTPVVGDWIVAITPKETNGCTLVAGNPYKISHVRGVVIRTEPLKSNGGEIYKNHCRKALPYEIPKEKSMNRKFSLGKVRFKGKKGGDSISTWYHDIPHVKHGDIYIHKDYDVDGAEIIGFHGEYYEVKYKDRNSNDVVLGFKEDQLEEFIPKKESLLEEAKRKYPIGTKFRCPCGNQDSGGEWNSNHLGDGIWEVVDHKQLGSGIHSGNGWIYRSGKWAEIVNSPQTEAKKPVQIEDSHKCPLKVGDEVEAIDCTEGLGWGNISIGAIGIVKEIRGDQYYVDFPKQKGWKGTRKDFRKTGINNSEVEFSEKIVQKPANIESPIKIDAEVSTLRIPITSASVTLKSTEKEVNLIVKHVQQIKIN